MNFDFLKDKQTFDSFSNDCIEAERAMQVSPSTVAILLHRALGKF